jgi:hypothetical protein
MANETTSTTYSDNSLAYALGERVLSANLPKIVVTGLCNEIDMSGEGSDTARINSHTDLGAASAGTEGTEFTTNEELALATAVDFVVAEAAAIQRAVITNFGLETKYPGVADVWRALQEGSIDQKLQILAEEADRMGFACVEKREDDLASLLDGFSNTVGSTGVDLTVTNMIAAQYTLKTLEPLHEDWVFVLTPNQIQELQLEIGVTGGGLGGSVWTGPADASFFNFRPDMPRNGFRGSFMNIPVYEYAHSLRELMNGTDDVAGALMLRGSGDPRKGGQPGGLALATRGFLKYHLEYSAGHRGVIFVVTSDHKAGEVRDTFGVTIVSDAP